MTLGEFIRNKRNEQDHSLTEFAKLIKRTPPFLYDIEMGRRYPSDEVLAEIARQLKVPMKELKEFDTRPPTKTMRTRLQTDPQLAVAFRKIIDSGLTSEEVMKAVEKAVDKKERQ